MEAQELSGQETENLAGNVMDGMGMPESGEGQEPENTDGNQEGNQPNAEQFAKKRINARNRERERQMQYMQAKIAELEARMSHPQPHEAETMNPHDAGLPAGDMAEHIHRAVNQVLAHKEAEERKVKQAQERAHIDKQYEELHNHLDSVADKYDDFDDVVRDPKNTSFTKHMRDASLFLPHTGAGSAGEVLYKLGKNKSELERISNLHPLEQARELNRLSHALAQGGASSNSSSPRPMGNIKSNPVNSSHAITDKTTPAEIRARMKAGRFK